MGFRNRFSSQSYFLPYTGRDKQRVLFDVVQDTLYVYSRIGWWSLRSASRWRTWAVRQVGWQMCTWSCRRCPAGPCRTLWPDNEKTDVVRSIEAWKSTHNSLHPPTEGRYIVVLCNIIARTIARTNEHAKTDPERAWAGSAPNPANRDLFESEIFSDSNTCSGVWAPYNAQYVGNTFDEWPLVGNFKNSSTFPQFSGLPKNKNSFFPRGRPGTIGTRGDCTRAIFSSTRKSKFRKNLRDR